MCGIAGQFFRSNEKSTTPFLDNMQEMLNVQSHRGPDGQGIYIDEKIILGHSRLSIIDPYGGEQPMSNEDQTLWLVCNGFPLIQMAYTVAPPQP